MTELKPAQWVGHTLKHPFEGFDDMRWRKSGSLKIAFFIVFMLFLSQIAEERLSGFQFRQAYDKIFNIVPFIVSSVVIFAAWVVGSRAIGTFLDGEGTMRNICIFSAYALVPYIAQSFINTLLTHILIQDELVFIEGIRIVGTAWTAVLLFSAVRSVHNYSVGRTFLAIALTVAAMFVMLILLVLFMSLIQQVYRFVYTIITELIYRARV